MRCVVVVGLVWVAVVLSFTQSCASGHACGVLALHSVGGYLTLGACSEGATPMQVSKEREEEPGGRSSLTGAAPSPQKKKKEPSDKKERKEEEKKERVEKKEEDDDSDGGSGCFFGLFDFADSDDSSSEISELTELPATLYVASVLPKGEGAILRTLWSDLGGEESGGIPVNTLRAHAKVNVHKERLYDDELWVQVSAVDDPEINGWMKKENVVEYEEMEEPYPDIPVWQFFGTFGGGVHFNGDLTEEYGAKMWTTGAGARMFSQGVLNLEFRGSYLRAYGDPSHVSYETASFTEYPKDSRLKLTRFSFGVGTYHYIHDASSILYWSAGPALVLLDEEADVEVVGNETVTVRKDKLDQTRPGLDMYVGMQGNVGNSVPIFIELGFYVIPVHRHEVKSLTIDWLDSSVLRGFTFSFGLGGSFYQPR